MVIYNAINDFYKARRKANLEQFLSRLTGQSADLLSYEEVRRTVRANRQVDLGLQDVPLAAIVGSVGRYRDFTRTFLPKESTDKQRWAGVMVQNSEGTGLPPIELYKIGEAYFVLDGNHRVSVAHELEMVSIEAYVTEVVGKVPFSLDDNPDKLLIAQQYVGFVEKTGLDELRPEADLQVTAPGKYTLLLDHIQVHHYFMGLDEKRDVAWSEAVAHWYDTVYLPMIALIREKGIMRDFPERTETDFYIWLAEHRAELKEALGWEVSSVRAVDTLGESKRPLLSRVNDSIWDHFRGEVEMPLANRKRWEVIEQVAGAAVQNKAVENVMVTLDGRELDWTAVDQAILIAQRESSYINGLYFPVEANADDEAALDQENVVREMFASRLSEAGVLGQMALADDEDWQRELLDRSRWNDIVVLGVGGVESDLRQRPWRQIAIRCPRPVLLVTDQVSPLRKILLGYDGRKYANQALSIATYLAGHWEIPLVVCFVGDGDHVARLQEKTDAYLAEHRVAATFVSYLSDVAISLLLTAEKQGCDVVIMGTYSHIPVLEMIRGTAVNTMLRNADRPILICQ